jgi:iron complex outermembrane receptor protein
MKALVLILFCSVAAVYQSTAQPAARKEADIKVLVVDEKQTPLDFVSVQLLQLPDSARIVSGASDAQGQVTLPAVAVGNYLVCVSRVNYQPACQLVSVKEESDLSVVVNFQLIKSDALEAVTITARKPPVQFLPDRTVLRVDASISAAGSTALELLERAPGITIDRDGNISLKGRDQVLVMIDNKPSYLSSSELSALLSGMSSNDIESIELIDKPPAKFDAAGNGGVINIRLKKNRQRGLNGNLTLSAAQGVYPKTNNALGLNYYRGKVNLFANYSYTMNQNYLDMYALRTYLAEDDKTPLSMMSQPTYIRSRVRNHTLRTGLDYSISKRTTVGMVLSGTLLKRSSLGSGEARWSSPGSDLDSLINTSSDNGIDWKNGAVNLNLRHRFSNKHELTADLDWLDYKMTGNQDFKNIRTDDFAYTETFRGNLPSRIQIGSFKADHSISLANEAKLESGVKWATTSTDNVAAFFINTGSGWVDDLGKTNHFIYDESIAAAYTSIQQQLDRWGYQLGLRYEHTSLKAHQLGNSVVKDSAFSRSYGSLFPTVQLSFRPDSIQEWGLSFTKRIDRPPYQKLNPFVSIINKYTYQQGNPLIRPQYTYTVELSHRYKQVLNTSLSYSHSKDYFSQIFITDTSGTIYYSEGNLGDRKIFGLSVAYTQQIIPAWTLTTQLDVQHKKLKGFVWKELEASITQFNISMNNQIRLAKKWSMEVSGYFISKSQADIQEVVEPTGQLGIGIARQVLRNKGSLKLNFRDIFYTQDMEGFTIFNQATEYFRLQRDTRLVNLSLSYRFGKAGKAPARRTNKVDEADRVGN